MTSSSKHRAFCFTINNPTGDDLDAVHALADSGSDYFVCGKEVAPTTGTPHLQGYVHFKSPRSLAAIRKLLRGHVIPANGTALHNRVYCTKDGDFFEHGQTPSDPAAQGKAEITRWEDAWTSAKAGDVEAIPADIRLRCYSTIKKVQADYMVAPPDLDAVCGLWYTGPAGTGKTTAARSANPGAFIKSRDRWWDGYQAQDVVILDDLDKYHVALAGYLKDWADKWTFKAEVKGGVRWIRPQVFIVTSQYEIDTIWEDQETREALHRRFKTTHFNKLL